jgi:serine/threonine protein kinase
VDFGLSRRYTVSSAETFGLIPYIDLKYFSNEKNQSKNYRFNKKSDVYSIGILMWQISSGREPFNETDYGAKLSLAITNGKREEIIDGTPVEYSNLYKGK